MQAVGAHQEAKAQEKAYKAQAAAAEQNAAIEAKKAEQVAENYAKKQKQLTDRMRLVKGQALASAGASGLSAGGSVADILGASQEAYEQDSLNLLSAQRNDTWSSYVNKVNYLNQAEAARVSAHNAREEGKAKIFSTLLGGAASIYGATAGAKNTVDTKNNFVASKGWVDDKEFTSIMNNNTWASGNMGINPYKKVKLSPNAITAGGGYF